MIAADTSSLVAFLRGDEGADVEAVDRALNTQILLLPPVALTEILSDDKLGKDVRSYMLALPLLETLPGFWARAGVMRAQILRRKLKARVGDALIAQSCIDHNVPLITRDADFRHFAKYGGLKLVGL